VWVRHIGSRVHQVAFRSSAPAAVHRPHPPTDRKPLAPAVRRDESTHIDNDMQLRQDFTMNTTLPRSSIAARFNAVLAAAFLTLATLGTIDHLANAPIAAPQVAQFVTAQQA
jgi:hypothetical protein